MEKDARKRDKGTRWMIRVLVLPFLMLILGLIFNDLAGYFMMGLWLYVLLLILVASLQVIKVTVEVFLKVFFKVKKMEIKLEAGKIKLDFFCKSEKRVE